MLAILGLGLLAAEYAEFIHRVERTGIFYPLLDVMKKLRFSVAKGKAFGACFQAIKRGI